MRESKLSYILYKGHKLDINKLTKREVYTGSALGGEACEFSIYDVGDKKETVMICIKHTNLIINDVPLHEVFVEFKYNAEDVPFKHISILKSQYYIHDFLLEDEDTLESILEASLQENGITNADKITHNIYCDIMSYLSQGTHYKKELERWNIQE